MYTSGRTVKSSAARPSTTAEATRTGRRLAKRHLAGDGVMVSSRMIAGTDGTVRMKTEISFSERDHAATARLAEAITELPAYHSMAWNLVSISYLTEV